MFNKTMNRPEYYYRIVDGDKDALAELWNSGYRKEISGSMWVAEAVTKNPTMKAYLLFDFIPTIVREGDPFQIQQFMGIFEDENSEAFYFTADEWEYLIDIRDSIKR